MESAHAAASGPHKTQVRRCARPGCADAANATLAFRYDLSQAWVTPLTEERSPATYDLCGPCADRTAPPRGWGLVDERPDLDARAPDADDHDAVRDAIAAALRGERDSVVAGAVARAAVPGSGPVSDFASRPLTGPRAAARRASQAPPLLATVAPPVPDSVASPPAGGAALEEAATAPSPHEEPAEVAFPSPRPVVVPGTLRSGTGESGRPDVAPRDVLAVRRRRPVEVLIGSGVSDVHDRSHAPVQHRLGSPLEQAPQTVEAAATSVLAVVPEQVLEAPRRETVGTPEAPPSPAPVSRPAFVAPAAAVPLAFDALPERLVSLGPDS